MKSALRVSVNAREAPPTALIGTARGSRSSRASKLKGTGSRGTVAKLQTQTMMYTARTVEMQYELAQLDKAIDETKK